MADARDVLIHVSPTTSAVVERLVLDLLEWLGKDGRPYEEVMEAWRTSCPRLPVWETANERALLQRFAKPGAGAFVRVSATGRALLAARLSVGSH